MEDRIQLTLREEIRRSFHIHAIEIPEYNNFESEVRFST